MKRQYKIFSIPAKGDRDVEEEMNQFLKLFRATHIHRKLIKDGENSYWTVMVEYEGEFKTPAAKPFKDKIDYRDVLSVEDFGLFTNLREWRLDKCREERVKAYVIFNDEQLAEIAEKRPETKTGLAEIKGLGKARAEKYGDDVIRIIKASNVTKENTPKREKDETE